MSRTTEFLYYLSVAVGLAIANASFAIMAQLFTLADTPVVLLATVIGAAILWLVAQTVGELASALPTAPGVRGYLHRAFGDGIATYATYAYLCFIVLVAALESFLFATVLRELLPHVSPLIVGGAVVLVIAAVNVIGISIPRWFQMGTTAVLVVALLGIGIWAIASSETASIAAATHARPGAGWASTETILVIVQCTALSMFLMVGFEWVTPLGLRAESYKALIPKAMIASVGLNMVLNLVFLAGLGLVLGRESASSTLTPQLALSRQLLGNTGLYSAALLAALSIASTFNAGLMGGSRLVYLLAREKKLPRFCAKVSLSSGAPIGAILTLSAASLIGMVLMITFHMEVVAAICGSAIACFMYAALVAAAWKLRNAPVFTNRSYRAPVSLPLRAVMAPALFVIGLLVLLDDPQYGAMPILALASVLLCSGVLLLMSRRKAADRTAPQQSSLRSPVRNQ